MTHDRNTAGSLPGRTGRNARRNQTVLFHRRSVRPRRGSDHGPILFGFRRRVRSAAFFLLTSPAILVHWTRRFRHPTLAKWNGLFSHAALGGMMERESNLFRCHSPLLEYSSLFAALFPSPSDFSSRHDSTTPEIPQLDKGGFVMGRSRSGRLTLVLLVAVLSFMLLAAECGDAIAAVSWKSAVSGNWSERHEMGYRDSPCLYGRCRHHG